MVFVIRMKKYAQLFAHIAHLEKITVLLVRKHASIAAKVIARLKR